MTPDPTAQAVALPRAAVAAPSVSDRARPNYKLLGLLALGHLVIDTNQGSLPALLPYLKSALGLTYAATGVIVLVANVASSLIQPLFGFLADKTARRWLLPLSVFLSALGISLIGVAPSYYAVLERPGEKLLENREHMERHDRFRSFKPSGSSTSMRLAATSIATQIDRANGISKSLPTTSSPVEPPSSNPVTTPSDSPVARSTTSQPANSLK